MKKATKQVKKTAKKPVGVPKNTAKPVAEVTYTLDIPEQDIPKLVKLDAAGMFCKAAKQICEMGKAAPYMMNDGFLEVADTCLAIAKCLHVVQEEYKKRSGKCCRGQKQSCNAPKAEFTEAEQKKIAAMRKKGASIKAIAKAIHRSDKKVALAVKLFDKASAKK